MIHLTTAATLEPLADACATLLAQPTADPLAPEWIAVPTGGVRAWLQRRLAARLGATSEGRLDGVSMNISFVRADGLRQALLGNGPSGGIHGAGHGSDGWSTTAMTWALMMIGADPSASGRNADVPLARWAMSHAERFGRYQVHRPNVLQGWLQERPRYAIAGTGVGAKSEHAQADLYRTMHDLLAAPDPVERLEDLFTASGDNSASPTRLLAVPTRLVVFGFTVPPDGGLFPRLADLVAKQCDLHVYGLDPLPGDEARWTPLGRSWGKPVDDGRKVLAQLPRASVEPQIHFDANPAADPQSLLGTLQRWISSGDRPAGLATNGDGSVIVHGCQGLTRQAEVLRDDLLGRFADDEALREEDVVVYCSDPERVAPILRATWGPSTMGNDADGVPRLRYHIDGLPLRAADPIADAFSRLLEMTTGRVTPVDLLGFCQLEPVRQRWGFDDDDIARFRDWVTALNVRWGLNPDHRSRFAVPASLSLGTWRRALDRLALGVAYASDDLVVAVPGDTAGALPFAIEGDDLDRLGRLSDLIARIEQLVECAIEPMDIETRLDQLRATVRGLLAPAKGKDDQLDRILRVCSVPDDAAAMLRSSEAGLTVTLSDIRPLLLAQLSSRGGASTPTRGGITVTTPDSFRGVPFRLTYLLDLDDSWVPTGTIESGDLLAADPKPGDPDRRNEARLSLLTALIASRDAVIVLVNARDIATNQIVPEAIVTSELLDALDGLSASDARELLVRDHPRQAIDPKCFQPGSSLSGTRPWSFDRVAYAATNARASELASPTKALWQTPTDRVTARASVIPLADLIDLIKDTTKVSTRNAFDLTLPYDNADPAEHLPTALTNLERFRLRREVLDDRLGDGLNDPSGEASDEELLTQLQAADRLPIASLGVAAFDDAVDTIDTLCEIAATVCADRNREVIDISLPIGGDRRIEGSIEVWRGPNDASVVDVLTSELKNADRLTALLRVVLLAASAPATSWRAALVAPKWKKPLLVAIPAQDAGDAELRNDTKDFVQRALDNFVRLYDVAQLGPLPLIPELFKLDGDFAANPGAAWRPWATERPIRRFVYGDVDFHTMRRATTHLDDPGIEGDPSAADTPGRIEHLGGLFMRMLKEAEALDKQSRGK